MNRVPLVAQAVEHIVGAVYFKIVERYDAIVMAQKIDVSLYNRNLYGLSLAVLVASGTYATEVEISVFLKGEIIVVAGNLVPRWSHFGRR